MKILQVNKLYWPWIGGMEKIVQQIAEGLNSRDDLEIEVLCCQPRGKKRDEEINGVKIWRASSLGIFLGMPISLDFFKSFKKLSQKADIIDIHHPFPLAGIAVFFFKPKAKIVIHYHSDIVRQRAVSFFIKPLMSHMLRRAERIIVSNDNLVKSSPCLARFEKKCEVIPFGVDLKKFDSCAWGKVEGYRKKYGDFILFVGRLSYYKGVDYLLRAMKKVDANLIIVGTGKLEEKLKWLSRKIGIEDKIIFLGKVGDDELVDLYNACAVFALPSIYKSEAFGIVLIEAMACGKPIVSTELGTGTSWVNQNRKTGFVVEPGNAKSLTTAINKILKDRGLAKEFGENARKRVIREFTLKKMIEHHKDLYKNL